MRSITARIGTALAAALLLSAGACASARQAPTTLATVRGAESFRDYLAAGEFDAARAMMSENPRQWFESADGDGRPWTVGPGGVGPWAAWDDHFRKRTEFVGWKGCERSATLTFRETNDYFQMLERGWVTNQAVYLFDERGRIDGLIIRAVGERPQGRTEEFLAWARANEPDELAYLRPGGEIDPTGERPRRHRGLLNRWRRSVGLAPIE